MSNNQVDEDKWFIAPSSIIHILLSIVVSSPPREGGRERLASISILGNYTIYTYIH